jgi:hypothetical protein
LDYIQKLESEVKNGKDNWWSRIIKNDKR